MIEAAYITLKSCSGVALMSNFEQLLRGIWKPETNEFLHMTLQEIRVFLTATHSHASPFAPLENVVCPILFGSASGSHDNHHHHHHHHGGLQEPSLPSPPQMPAKSREELNEGTRKRKAKKVE
ncbi:PREDICTED: trimeric intracellular cation channel type A-like [Thamnophis sirtalis]|uniref:Trimeric intracellular cation channel type A n=1 Tax=Thamnophis sirtalis TaxID=35019 RepID=A0A6I9XGR8_9SAUR|nr:PREDICTED: trimeric intracellular cation channel type A-like [Thamnophis sirtalis]